MTERHFRSSHSSVPVEKHKKRQISRKAALPVALAALGSVLFGTQASYAIDQPKVEKIPKTKGATTHNDTGHHSTAPVLADKYHVAAGDTVHGIAQMHGVSSAELLAANGLSWKTMIFAGQQLNIPAQTNGTEKAEVGETIKRHQVMAGETLAQISRNYNVQPQAIMRANGLDYSSRLVVGQRLVIPDQHFMSTIPAADAASA